MLDTGELENAKSMSIIVTKGSLDWAYPPFILGTTAAAMDVDVTMFFTFYGLPLLKKDLNLDFELASDPDMETIKALGTLDEENEISWPAIILIEDGKVSYRWIADSASERIAADEVVRKIKSAM